MGGLYEMKQKGKELMGVYKNYMALKMAIEGTAYLSDDGLLIIREIPVQKQKTARKGEMD